MYSFWGTSSHRLLTGGALCMAQLAVVAPAIAQEAATPPPLEGGPKASAANDGTESTAAPEEKAKPQDGAADLKEQPSLTAADVAERRKRAIDLYDMGQSEEAFRELDSLLADCLESGDAPCDATVRAVLFRDAGVVLAAGMSKHGPAVRAFRRALRESPEIEVSNAYRTERVDAALDEAKRAEGLAPAAPASASAPSTEYYKASYDDSSGGHLGKHFLFEASGLIGMGAQIASIDSGTTNYAIDGTGETGVLGLGASALGAYVSNGGLALGGRLGFRHYHLFEMDNGFGTWGASAVVGGVLGRKTSPTFHYLLGGVGFQNYPGRGLVGWDLNFEYGASINGVAVGCDASVMQFRQDFYDPMSGGTATAITTTVLFAAHVGFADLF